MVIATRIMLSLLVHFLSEIWEVNTPAYLRTRTEVLLKAEARITPTKYNSCCQYT